MSHIFSKQSLKVIVILISGMMFSACNDNSPPTMNVDEPDVDDISLSATLTVSNENPDGPFGNEGSSKLIDGDANTKFLTFEYHEGFWMMQEFEGQVSINAYTMTSGNDAPDRDPLNWILEGSNDSENWDVIHAVSDATFEARNHINIYLLDSDETYSIFRLSITDNAGETTLLQISEWRLLYYNAPMPEV